MFSAEYNAHLWILESEDQSVVVRWVQPGRCHYGEQKWRRGGARRVGHCAITGRPINRGDAVYRPDSKYVACTNAQAMIHEDAMREAAR
ncbi:DUF3331 domain-containing protein [Burkholderia sp. PU8-34]